MKALVTALVAAVAVASLASAADAGPMHHRHAMKVCSMHHHHRVCRTVWR